MALLFIAALSTAALMPLAVRVGGLVGAVDLPDGGRKRHAAPTPRFAGPALYFALWLTLLLFGERDARSVAILAGGGLTVALGVTDDVCSLSPRVKLLAELAIAAIPPAFGLLPRAVWLFGRILPLPPLLAWPLSVLWIVLVANACNMIDGLDGLAAGQSALIALALFLGTPHPTAAVLSGATLGFLPYNHPYPTASGRRTASFLGDGGALLLGYCLALLPLGEIFYLPVLWFFALPLYDLATSVLRRLYRGVSPFAADGGHLHHRLLGRGLSAGEAVILWLLAAWLLALVGCARLAAIFSP